MGYEQHQHDFTGIVLGIQLLLGLSQPSVLFSKQTELLWLSGQVLLYQLLCAGFQAASTASSTKLLQSLWKFSILFSSEWKMLCLPGEELLPELFAAACWWPATIYASAASSATTVVLIERASNKQALCQRRGHGAMCLSLTTPECLVERRM